MVLSNTNNFEQDLFDPQKILPLQLRVDLGVMTIKRYSMLSQFPELDSVLSANSI